MLQAEAEVHMFRVCSCANYFISLTNFNFIVSPPSFSYTDTIKVLERWGPGSVVFFDDPDSNMKALEEFITSPNRDQDPVAALFCEFPSNPLLQSPNLPYLRKLANQNGFLIVIDETVGGFVNVDVLQYADIITTSMSKLFSGSANVMGGR